MKGSAKQGSEAQGMQLPGGIKGADEAGKLRCAGDQRTGACAAKAGAVRKQYPVIAPIAFFGRRHGGAWAGAL